MIPQTSSDGRDGGAADNRQQAKVQALIYTYLLNELSADDSG